MDLSAQQAVGDALHWIRVTQLQVQRFTDSFISEAETEERDFLKTVADGHFLLNAAAQAEKALRRIDRHLSSERTLQLRTLRNVHEHWEQHRESFASPQHVKSRAGKTFADAYPDAIPWNFKFDGTGTWISSLRLEDLWAELLDVERTLAELTTASDPGTPAPREDPRFPRRDSKVLGFALVTQNIVLDFDDPSDAHRGEDG